MGRAVEDLFVIVVVLAVLAIVAIVLGGGAYAGAAVAGGVGCGISGYLGLLVLIIILWLFCVSFGAG